MGKMKEKYIEYMEKIAGSEDDGYGQFVADEKPDSIVKIPDWEDTINAAFAQLWRGTTHQIVWSRPSKLVEGFLTVIWNMSVTAFDQPREVQVIVDGDDKLFISFGTPGYVDFPEEPTGMKLPLKCWIHTHPFGDAYFSGTDWKTIDTWKTLMQSAIVLGDNEYWAYNIPREVCKQVKYGKLVSPKKRQREKLEQRTASYQEAVDWLAKNSVYSNALGHGTAYRHEALAQGMLKNVEEFEMKYAHLLPLNKEEE